MLTYTDTINDETSIYVFNKRPDGVNNYIDVNNGKCVQLYTKYGCRHGEEGYEIDKVILGSEVLAEHGLLCDDTKLFDDYIDNDELNLLNSLMESESLSPSYYIVTHNIYDTEVSIVFDKDKHIDRYHIENILPNQIRTMHKTIYINAAY